jgi:two-component system response regulator RegA
MTLRSARTRALAPEPGRALFACCRPDPTLVRALEELSTEVESVSRAGEVGARIEQWQPAGVVLDLDAAGADALALQFTPSPGRAQRVVLLASASSVFSAMKCLASRRADHVLMKPADVDELASILTASTAATPPRLPSLERIQWEYIRAVLGSCDGNVSQAARQLGIYRQSLQRMLRRHPPHR